jgi:pilus assembly protein CpaF
MILTNDIFHLELQGEGPDGRLIGQYRVNRLPPSFQERLVYFGLDRAWATALAGNVG